MKHLNKILIGAAIGFLALTGVVLSQVQPVPTVSILHPTDLMQVVPLGQPTAQSQYTIPNRVSNTYGYYKSPASAPATNFVYQFSDTVTYASFTPSGTLAYGYMVLNTAPSDGTRNCFFSTAAITTLGVCISTPTGSCTTTGINAGVTTLAANAGACYLYSASNQTWDRD